MNREYRQVRVYGQRFSGFPILLVMMEMCLIYLIMPIVSRAISSYVTTYAYMLLMLIVFVQVIFLDRNETNVNLRILFSYFPIIMLQLMFVFIHNATSLIIFLYGWMLSLLSPIISRYVLTRKPQYARSLLRVLIFAYVVTMLTTIYGLISSPEAARYIATADSDDARYIALSWRNIGGFNTIYSLTLLYPMVICAFKQGKLKLSVMIAFFSLLLALLILAQYATALILFAFSSMLLLRKKSFTSKSVYTMVALMLLFIYFLGPVLGNWLEKAASGIESRTLSERFLYLADTLRGYKTDSDVGNRINVWMGSVNSFIASPLIGRGFFYRYASGGHSFILDTLANFGLMGGLALVIMYRKIFTMFYKPYKRVIYFGYMMWSFYLCIFLSFINTGDWLFVLTLGIPLIVKAINTPSIIVPRNRRSIH